MLKTISTFPMTRSARRLCTPSDTKTSVKSGISNTANCSPSRSGAFTRTVTNAQIMKQNSRMMSGETRGRVHPVRKSMTNVKATNASTALTVTG